MSDSRTTLYTVTVRCVPRQCELQNLACSVHENVVPEFHNPAITRETKAFMLSLGGGHEGAKGVGWNPASNSEGGEGFVVREVQGRRAPLNTKGVETSANITGYCQNPSRHGATKQWQILVPTATPQLCGGTEWGTVATQCNSP